MGQAVTDIVAPDKSELRLGLLAEASSVVLARNLVKYAVLGWGWDGLVDDAIVVASELVTNAVQVVLGDEIRLRVSRQADGVLLEVWDPSPKLPTASPVALDAEEGRGLFIVATLAKKHGVRPASEGATGKVVWALVPK
jgi:anti-sigma regulatory factor (Ser/Thr protein kinase)